MFQDVKLKPLLVEESYTLHGKEAQIFFSNKIYTAARRGDTLGLTAGNPGDYAKGYKRADGCAVPDWFVDEHHKSVDMWKTNQARTRGVQWWRWWQAA